MGQTSKIVLGEEGVEYTRKESYADRVFIGRFYACLFEHADMFGSDAKKASFHSCLFAFCDMGSADMSETIFENCVFIGCYGRDANFNDAHFKECNLKAVMFNETHFTDATFQDSDLSGSYIRSDFTGVSFTNCTNHGCILTGAKGLPAAD